MKRKLMILVLSLALAATLIPTLSAYADDELNQGNSTTQMVQAQGNIPDLPDAVAQSESGQAGQEDEATADLPKINLKSPVTQLSQSKIGTQITLVAKIGSKVVDSSLITWTSGNESVATVSPEGIVTVIGVGKATITAVMTDGTARNGYAKIFVFPLKNTPADTHIGNVGASHNHHAVTHPINSHNKKN